MASDGSASTIPPSSTSRGEGVRLVALGRGVRQRVFPIEGDVLLLGRAMEADVRINAPELSRRHAELRRSERGVWHINDLGSRNGTQVNGVPVVRSQALQVGDTITLGEVTLVFSRQDDVGDKLLELEKMEALGHLAAGVAHDFRNLLSVMGSNLEYIQTELRRPEPQMDEVMGCLDESSQAILRATELTARLLGVARPDLQAESEVDISALMEEVAALCRRSFPETVEVVREISPALSVLGDQSALHRVITNLCFNARDAMPHGGVVTLRAQWGGGGLPGLVSDGGATVTLEIEDTGEGMDAATRARIFDPFFTTKGKAGTGLGLATVHSVIRHHGGDISVTSEFGHGSTFRIVLPSNGDDHPLETLYRIPSVEVRVPETRGTLLLVDDERLVLQASGRLMESWGYDVRVALSGAEAVEIFEAHREELSCMVVDVQMPGIDGPSLLRILRLIDPELRAILTSARMGIEEGEALLGPHDFFVLKPHGDNLRAVLRKVLGA